ncbi:MAG: ribosomal-processing cysteine protease Prp [Spirochaetales bacterium]|nr:ribosomal-processing cysteine protease Prp [Spirochaetales bacterium]
MIKVICIVENSLLKYIKVTGHADNKNQKIIVCTAVSCLIRTACDITRRLIGVDSYIDAPNPGYVVLKVNNIENCLKEKYIGITDYLIYGLIGVKHDFPDSIKLKINNKEWYDGSQKRWW